LLIDDVCFEHSVLRYISDFVLRISHSLPAHRPILSHIINQQSDTLKSLGSPFQPNFSLAASATTHLKLLDPVIVFYQKLWKFLGLS